MSSALVLVDNVDPVTGLLLHRLAESFKKTFVLNIKDGQFMGPNKVSIPVWASDLESPEFGLWLRDLAEYESIEVAIGQGFASAEFATKLRDIRKTVGLLLPGDCDISGRRKHRLQRFRSLSERLNALVFLNDWEMFKASSLGSAAPHFVWDFASDSSSVEWNAGFVPSENEKIVVYYDHRVHGSDVTLEQLGFDSLMQKFDDHQIDCRPSNSLFWYSDLMINRQLQNTVRLRANGVSKAIFIDNDANSLIGLALLQRAEGLGLWATHSVEHELLSNKITGLSIGSQPRILAGLIGGDIEPILAQKPKSIEKFSGRSLLEVLERVGGEELPRFFEDFGDSDKMSIFFSVAPLENRSNGARPQRIRNMYLAMAREKTVVHLSINESVMDRRIPLVDYYVGKGVKFEYFYGENSTNPIDGLDAPLRITRLLDDLAHSCGIKSAYFVRDVHWLDPNLNGVEKALSPNKISSGRFELQRFENSVGELIAPSLESARNYSRLAAPYFSLEFGDHELPPAISVRNVVGAGSAQAESVRTTFVYTGGVSELYSMDVYLQALAELRKSHGESFYADFIVREDEKQLLLDWLDSVGLSDAQNLRILTESFDLYSSRSNKNVGVLLLDSEYGRNAFAFKAVSYMERLMPFISYSDSPNNRYLSRHGVSIPVSGRASVLQALQDGLEFNHASLNWTQIISQENWDCRWETVKEIAAVQIREKR